MPRIARVAPGGRVYHVLNHAAGRAKLFRNDRDYAAFERAMIETHNRFPLRILAYAVLASHWHFLVWPRRDGDLSDFFRWLAHAHAMRWRVDRQRHSHHYQGRFKSFIVQEDKHFLTVARYVERAAVSANLVRRAEQWRWSSLGARTHGDDPVQSILSEWPVARPRNWARIVNTPLIDRELEHLEPSVTRGRPFGDDRWVARTVARLGLEHTVRREGRPSKIPER